MTPLSFPKYGFAAKSLASVVGAMLIFSITAGQARELTPLSLIHI